MKRTDTPSRCDALARADLLLVVADLLRSPATSAEVRAISDEDLAEIGLTGAPQDNVLRLAALAESAGLDGVVCSSREVEPLRGRIGKEFKLVTPGIRPAGADVGDQKRIMTPGNAIRAGSDYLVIGRPITAADDPMGALLTIENEISQLI